MNEPKEMDWIIHYIINDVGPGGIINAHTHGMEKYGHLDFQVVLPLPAKHICYLLNTIGKRVQSGEKYHSGNLVDGIYEDCPIRLQQFRETNRDVLRLIIPDKNNLFPENPDCQDKYKVQLNHAFEY